MVGKGEDLEVAGCAGGGRFVGVGGEGSCGGDVVFAEEAVVEGPAGEGGGGVGGCYAGDEVGEGGDFTGGGRGEKEESKGVILVERMMMGFAGVGLPGYWHLCTAAPLY